MSLFFIFLFSSSQLIRKIESDTNEISEIKREHLVWNENENESEIIENENENKIEIDF